MAGAGGLLVMLVGALIGGVAGVAALALFAFGFRKMRPAQSRLAAFFVGGAAVLSIVLTLPAWIVILSGKDTRGEPFDAREIDLWMYALLLTPVGTLVALVGRRWARRTPR